MTYTPRLNLLAQEGGIPLPTAATLAQCSISTLRRAIDDGILCARYPSHGRPVVLRADLNKWLRRGALTLDQAAVYCGVSRRTLDRIIAAGDLTPRYPAGSPLLLRVELDEWLENLPTEPRAAA